MTKVDDSLSRYREVPSVNDEFNRMERKRLRLILRRLRFLEHKVREGGGLADPNANGGAAYTEWEIEALEWILQEVGFIEMVPTSDD